MSLRRVLAVLAWALVVLACSGGVWGVIRTAGAGVTTSPNIPAATTEVAPTPGPSTPARRPGGHHRKAHPSPAGHAASATPTAPAPSPAATPAAPPSGTGQRTGSDGQDQSGASGGQQQPEVRRTWQGQAGAVVASCQGGTITLRGAQPNSGWRVEVGNRGPQQVEVNFSTRQDDGGEVEVRARCVGGEPRFSAAGD